MRQFILSFLGIFFLLQTTALAASFGISRNGRLDQAALAKAYKESDWEKVTQTLENYLKGGADSKLDIEERIFAYKYLGTIYAADTMSQTKSESYYNRLLDLSPTIEIFDLYASKKINDFFEGVKRDHERSRNYANKFDSYGREQKNPTGTARSNDSMPTFSANQRSPQPIPSHRQAEMDKKSSNAWVWWTVGIAAAAGAGASVYYMTTTDTKVVTQDLNPTNPTP